MMLNYDYLSPDTKELLLTLREQKWIEPFILVGGSALTIQIAHRQSEDLDFILDSEYLELNYLKRSIHKLSSGSYRIIKIDDPYHAL
jgi:hypothetical protein